MLQRCRQIEMFQEELKEFLISLCPISSSLGFSVAVIDEEGTQQLHITEVKAGGLASAKGTLYTFVFY